MLGLKKLKQQVSPESNKLVGDEDVEYEDAISRAGYGKFHYAVLLLCGWAISSDAIELLSVSFILPPAGCDLHLTNFDKGLLNSIIFVGMMIGGYGWGSLSDIHGRRSILVWSLALNALGGLASSFVQDYYLFLLLRLISGIGVGGSQPVIFSYFVEFQPKSRRGAMVSSLASFWVSGNIIAAGLAWAVIPQTSWYFHTTGFTYDSWRIYIALCTIPSLTGALSFIFMPESPKFLLQVNRNGEALRVLQKVYRWNRGRGALSYNVRSLASLKSHDPVRGSEYVPDPIRTSLGNWCHKSYFLLKKFVMKTFRLFSRRLLRITLVSFYVYSTLSFGYYGLFMWLPTLFERMARYGGSACDAPYMNSSVVPPDPGQNGSCVVDHSDKIYREGFITAVSTMPGNILAIFIMDYVGGRILMALAMVGSGVSVFFLWFVSNESQGLIMSCIFSGVANIGWVALDVVVVEVFPTEVRSTAIGLLSVAARISGILGNVAFGALVATNCAVPMFLVMGFLSTGGLSALILPNKKRQDID